MPQLGICNEKGISKEEAQLLLKGLQKEAQKHVGNAMVFDLSMYVQEFLFEHRKPSETSFYEQMIQRQQQQQLKEQAKLDQEASKCLFFFRKMQFKSVK